MPFGQALELAKNDGFGNDEDAPVADYAVWLGETNAHSASVMFLHGALHLFDTGKELIKYTWVRKGVPLIDHAREALANNAFPLFVAEGKSAQKTTKIRQRVFVPGLILRSPLPAAALIVLIGLLAGARSHVRSRNYLAYSAVTTPLVILIVDAGRPPEWALLADRLLATMIGGLLVTLSDIAFRPRVPAA